MLNRDHSSVFHVVNAIAARAKDPAFAQTLSTIEKAVMER
jgi:hypothetical protein